MMRKIAMGFAFVGAFALFGTTTALAGHGDPHHGGFHDDLEHREFHRHLRHRDAHRYPMTPPQHGRLHDQLDHERFHDRLDHRQYHRYRHHPRSPYGYGGRQFYFRYGR